jgi:hypothetical protein
METLQAHIGVLVSIMGAMVTLVGFLIVILGRVVYTNNRLEQDRQNERIVVLERAQNEISGEHGITKNDVGHLGELLKQMVEELREERRERQAYEVVNSNEHTEIKGLIRRAPAVASA